VLGLAGLLAAGVAIAIVVAMRKPPPLPPVPPPPVAAPTPEPAPAPVRPLPPDYADVDPFQSSPDVVALAKRSTGKGAARVMSLAAVIRGAVARGGGRMVSPGLHTVLPPRTPAKLAEALKAGAAGRVGSLEAALLLVATSREAGIKASLGEAHRLKGGSYADPGGSTGYFVATVQDVAPPVWIDPLGAPVLRATAHGDRAAHAYFLAVAARGEHAADPEAKQKIEDLMAGAKRLAPEPTATLLAIESSVLIAAGRAPEALIAAQAAIQIRDDLPLRVVLALAHNAAMDDRAFRDELFKVANNGELVPAFHLAGIYNLDTGRLGEAVRLLARAERVARGAPATLILRAQVALKQGNKKAAEAAALAAVAADPDSLQNRMTAFLILKRLGNNKAADRLREDAAKSARNPKAALALFARVAGE